MDSYKRHTTTKMMTNNTTKTMTNTRQFPAAFGGQRGRGGRGGAPPPYRALPPKKEVPVEKKIDINSEMNFPSLGKNDSTWAAADSKPPALPGAGGGGKLFATLASSWKDADDAEQERIEYERQEAEREAQEYKRLTGIRRFAPSSTHVTVTSSRLYRYEDDYDDEEDGEYNAPIPQARNVDAEWQTVDRSTKSRRYADEGLDEDYDY